MRNWLLVAALAVPLATPASAISIDWVGVGDPGNAADSTGFGAVGYAYKISKYEVTNTQYAEFLNYKAASDPLGLYSASLAADGITRSGSSGSYTYTVNPGFASKPVLYVSFFDALRFANWFHNGGGSGSTETGAYTLLGGTALPSNYLTVTRNVGATIALTSENEWYKAAYYDPTSFIYYDYPAGSNTVTGCVGPASDTGNSANCSYGAYFATGNAITNGGAYALSDSPYGTYDQGGNASEWTESIGSGGSRVTRGGNFSSTSGFLAASFSFPLGVNSELGFRVVSIPEPASVPLLAAALAGLVARRRHRRHG